MQITGVVLAGGLSRRMGGADKGLMDFLGKPMVTHVIERVLPQVNELLINANREISRYQALGYPVVQDDISGFAGPLAGLHAAIKVSKSPFVLTVPCDCPLLPPDLASRLAQHLVEHQAEIAVARTGSQSHPVFCLCKTSLLSSLENYLSSGERKMDIWQQSVNIAEVSFDDNPRAFSNINTAQELSQLLLSIP